MSTRSVSSSSRARSCSSAWGSSPARARGAVDDAVDEPGRRGHRGDRGRELGDPMMASLTAIRTVAAREIATRWIMWPIALVLAALAMAVPRLASAGDQLAMADAM